MNDTHSVAAGLDYIGVGPILAHLYRRGRVRFEAATDAEVVEALRLDDPERGPHPGPRERARVRRGVQGGAAPLARRRLLINQSGRGDKDIFTVADALGDERWKDFIRQKAASYGPPAGERKGAR